MQGRTPFTLITGPLGSGKTTLIRHILNSVHRKMAILMNEFGDIAIDSQIIEGKNVQLAELEGGCICCSLLGEFEAAVEEILVKVQPEAIVVETTGIAEPQSLIADIEEILTAIRLDGVVTVADADGMIQFPHLGHTTRMQLEEADLVLLNKIDLVSTPAQIEIRDSIRRYNRVAPIVATQRCIVDPLLLFGLGREKKIHPDQHRHQPEFASTHHISEKIFRRDRFEEFANKLSDFTYRAKGFIRFPDGTFLFNYVGGRWDLEPFSHGKTELVFIGERDKLQKDRILEALKKCEE